MTSETLKTPCLAVGHGEQDGPQRNPLHVVSRGVAWNWIGFSIAGAVSFAITPFMIRHLGLLYYGIWMLGHSVLSYYTLCDLGLSPSVQRFVALSRSTGNPRITTETVSAAVAIMTMMGLLIGLASVVIATLLPRLGLVPRENVSLLRVVLLLLATSVALSFPARPLNAYLCGVHRFDLANGVSSTATLLRAAGVWFVLNHGYGVIAVCLVTLASATLSLVAYVALVRVVDRTVLRYFEGFHLGRMGNLAQFSLFIFLADIGEYLRLYLDLIVVAKCVGVIAVTYYSVAANLISFHNNIMAGAAGPLMTELVGRDAGKADEGYSFFFRASKITALLSTLGAVLLLSNGKLLFQVWLGPKFAFVYLTLAVLTVAHWADRSQGPSMHLLYSRGRHRAMAYWTIIEGVTNLVLSIYLAKRYGILGVAIGTAVPLMIVKLLVQPLYTLHVLGATMSEYLRQAVGPALLVGGFVLLAGYLVTIHTASIATLVFRIVWQTSLFGGTAYLVALTTTERRLISEHLTFDLLRRPRSPQQA